MVFAADAQITIECSERKIDDLGKSADGTPAAEPKKAGWFGS